MPKRIDHALAANVAGTVLGIAAVAAAPWAMLCSVRGRWVGLRPRRTPLAWAAVGIFVLMLLDWARRLLAG